jgi:GT2 family glycosyltransferase
MLDEMKKKPLSVAYGNDLLMGEKLPTAVLMSSEIVQKLGYMAPPTLKHQWSDLFWLWLGRDSGTLTYFPDIVIEHLHHSVGKSTIDQTYVDATNLKMKRQDSSAWQKYYQEQFAKDLEKLK